MKMHSAFEEPNTASNRRVVIAELAEDTVDKEIAEKKLPVNSGCVEDGVNEQGSFPSTCNSSSASGHAARHDALRERLR